MLWELDEVAKSRFEWERRNGGEAVAADEYGREGEGL